MLIGEYIHTIDEKNRVSMPAKFRKELGKKFIITPGLGNCLFIFTNKEWEKVSKKLSDSDNDLSFLKADQRSFNRYMFGRAAEVETRRLSESRIGWKCGMKKVGRSRRKPPPSRRSNWQRSLEARKIRCKVYIGQFF